MSESPGLPEEILLQDSIGLKEVTHRLISQAQSVVRLYTHDLEHMVFERPQVIRAMSDLIKNHKDAEWQVLINEGRIAVKTAPRLVELARRLSPQVQFRKPARHQTEFQLTYLLVDNKGYWLRPRRDRYQGTASFNAPGRVAELTQHFKDIWEYAQPDEEVRRLYL